MQREDTSSDEQLEDGDEQLEDGDEREARVEEEYRVGEEPVRQVETENEGPHQHEALGRTQSHTTSTTSAGRVSGRALRGSAVQSLAASHHR